MELGFGCVMSPLFFEAKFPWDHFQQSFRRETSVCTAKIIRPAESKRDGGHPRGCHPEAQRAGVRRRLAIEFTTLNCGRSRASC